MVSDRVLSCDASGLVTLNHHDGARAIATDALSGLRWLDERRRKTAKRWSGFLSYDLGRLLDDTRLASRGSRFPLYAFAEEGSPERDVGTQPTLASPRHPTKLRRDFTRPEYLDAVRRCKEYIAAGDVFQVNLSQRFSVEINEPPLDIYRRISSRYPASFGAFLDFGAFALVCNSPELFLRAIPLSDGRSRVLTRPIKGTRPRKPGADLLLRKSIKDQAELNMVVDLERNDLGRVCEIGTVRVSQPRTIEAHPTVYHGVATIEGILREDVGLAELLAATFPGGSVTGAPKIRAMQIIDELERTPRGPYCGAIGHLAPDGGLELSLAIRTMIIADGVAHVHVGGGIVADSDPIEEYEETLVKARAMFEALGVAMDDVGD